MKIPDNVRKTVGFVCHKDLVDSNIAPVGSFFFLGHDVAPGRPRIYAVTARHMIDGLRNAGVTEAVLRLNPKAHDAELIEMSVPLDQWFEHPTDNSIDVAIRETGIPENADHLALPFRLCATPQLFDDNEVALGDEVFVSGLFRAHPGNKRNIPIVRIGNIAAFDEEKIETEAFGAMDAYLIECKSMGGLSGSPVFLNLGSVRIIARELRHAPEGAPPFLIGLVHGNYSRETANAGIALVVPIYSILSVVEAYEAIQS
jgi:hypothetical protein